MIHKIIYNKFLKKYKINKIKIYNLMKKYKINLFKIKINNKTVESILIKLSLIFFFKKILIIRIFYLIKKIKLI